MVRPFSLSALLIAGSIRAVIADYDTSFNPITNPLSDDTIYAGEYFDITWINNTVDPISLLLFFWGTGRNWILADNIPNTGLYHWWVSDKIAYPTLVNTDYAGDPYWFEIHIYNGSFRKTMGPNADSYIGTAENVMKMDKGGLWFNITAPTYSVEVYSVVTVNPTSYKTISGGTTETFPITWPTVPPPSSLSNSATSGTKVGSRTSTSRVPTFASISEGIPNWKSKSIVIVWVILAIVVGVVAVV